MYTCIHMHIYMHTLGRTDIMHTDAQTNIYAKQYKERHVNSLKTDEDKKVIRKT